MRLIKEIKESLLHLAFPHVCEGCGNDTIEVNNLLCLRCLSSFPETNFQFYPNNPVEKLFWGRMAVTYATAQYYFTKESLIQNLMHQLKYRGNRDLGLFLGTLMGTGLGASNRFSFIDALVPLPLFAARERKRGYNQAMILCEGIAGIMNKPILKEVIIRTTNTESQTKKGRTERWQNMEGKFELIHPAAIEGKHVLLIDDVITTGATLEACGSELLKVQNVQLSIATLCFSFH